MLRGGGGGFQAAGNTIKGEITLAKAPPSGKGGTTAKHCALKLNSRDQTEEKSRGQARRGFPAY